jgi:hypothetical protein
MAIESYVDPNVRQPPSGVTIRKKYAPLVRLLTDSESPFSRDTKDSLSAEWEEIKRRTAEVDARETELMRHARRKVESRYGTKLLTKTDSGAKQSRPIFSGLILQIVNFLLEAGASKRAAFALTGQTLKLLAGDWFTDSDLNNVRQRYEYHKKKGAKGKSKE